MRKSLGFLQCFAVVFSFLLLNHESWAIEKTKQFEKAETSSEIRQIVAQAACLIEAYPNSVISKDASIVMGAYVQSLGPKFKFEKLKALAKDLNPGRLSVVGQNNFGIAKCVLFGSSKDVLKLFVTDSI